MPIFDYKCWDVDEMEREEARSIRSAYPEHAASILHELLDGEDGTVTKSRAIAVSNNGAVSYFKTSSVVEVRYRSEPAEMAACKSCSKPYPKACFRKGRCGPCQCDMSDKQAWEAKVLLNEVVGMSKARVEEWAKENETDIIEFFRPVTKNSVILTFDGGFVIHAAFLWPDD